jgi:hypothetical protein
MQSSDAITTVDVVFYGTLYEAFSTAKEPSNYPTLQAWFDVVSKNEKISAGVEFIKEQVYIQRRTGNRQGANQVYDKKTELQGC